ncbi:MAG: hypothetical protein U0942_15960 [Parvibaculum sp.]|uniref:hypothetical protein n=1 Tax=Parvibaculum sp. TaxID=2024848 RepID=UPI002AB9C896|nr:hypothetical protein [Parvibaculum sp.]MDZ4382827.1 hypothetical protein [Parvibaculum sp.]
MMLSFSIPAMRPMIEAGLRQRAGEELPEAARVKRQTIRARGPVWQRVLAGTEGGRDLGGRVERDLHLWWKSRTKERALMGVVRGFEIYPVTISRDDDAKYVIVQHPGAYIVGQPTRLRLAWSPEIFDFALADGFEHAEAFADFFVPRPGDRFAGALIKW